MGQLEKPHQVLENDKDRFCTERTGTASKAQFMLSIYYAGGEKVPCGPHINTSDGVLKVDEDVEEYLQCELDVDNAIVLDAYSALSQQATTGEVRLRIKTSGE